MVRVDGNGNGEGLIRVRGLDKSYRRGGEEIHVLSCAHYTVRCKGKPADQRRRHTGLFEHRDHFRDLSAQP